MGGTNERAPRERERRKECVVVVSISTRGVEYGVQEGGGRGNLVEEKKGERDKVRVCVCV